MGRAVQTPEKFEVWDGGHCYLRANREKGPDGTFISLVRFPTRASVQEIVRLAAWAITKEEEDASPDRSDG